MYTMECKSIGCKRENLKQIFNYRDNQTWLRNNGLLQNISFSKRIEILEKADF